MSINAQAITLEACNNDEMRSIFSMEAH